MDASGADIVLTGEVTVPAGKTLTIEPGTVIRPDVVSDDRAAGLDPSRIELIIEGSLVLNGIGGSCSTDPARPCLVDEQCLDGGVCQGADPVIFTSNRNGFCSISSDPCDEEQDCPAGQTCNNAPQAGDWYGIRYDGQTADVTSEIRNVQIEYGVRGVVGANGAIPDVKTVVVREMTVAGLRFEAVGTQPLAASRAGWVCTDAYLDRANLQSSGFRQPSSLEFEFRGSDPTWDGALHRIARNLVTGTKSDKDAISIFGNGSTAKDQEFEVLDNRVSDGGFRGIYVGQFTTPKIAISGNHVSGVSNGIRTENSGFLNVGSGTVRVENNVVDSYSSIGIAVSRHISSSGQWTDVVVRGNHVVTASGVGQSGIVVDSCVTACRSRIEANDVTGGSTAIRAATGQIVRNRVRDASVAAVGSAAADYVLLYNDLETSAGATIDYDTVHPANLLVPRLHWNRLASTSGTLVRNDAAVNAVDARRNYWAGQSFVNYPANVDAIYDAEDDATISRVNFDGWLAADPSGTGVCSISATECASALACPSGETCQGVITIRSSVVSPHDVIRNASPPAIPVVATSLPSIRGVAYATEGLRSVEIRIADDMGGVVQDWTAATGSQGQPCLDDGTAADRSDCVTWRHVPTAPLGDGILRRHHTRNGSDRDRGARFRIPRPDPGRRRFGPDRKGLGPSE